MPTAQVPVAVAGSFDENWYVYAPSASATRFSATGFGGVVTSPERTGNVPYPGTVGPAIVIDSVVNFRGAGPVTGLGSVAGTGALGDGTIGPTRSRRRN